MRVVAFDVDNRGWSAALRGVPHDVYHLPEYAAFAARRQLNGEPTLFVVEEGEQRMLLPVIVRDLPAWGTGSSEGRRDATSARGYPGLAATSPAHGGDDFQGRALEALRDALRDRGIVSLYVRLHPLFPVEDEALRQHGQLVEHGDAIYVDLAQSDDEWRGTMRHGHRQDINRARRLGYVPRIDERWDRFDQFVALFAESMERVGALSHWRLDREYFVDLRASLGERLHLCVVEHADEVAAAALLTEVDGIVEYHLAGAASAHMRASPSKLVIDHARTWAKHRGNRVLHLTGSLSRDDSLSHFKRGFSPLQLPVRSWRSITHPGEYERLVACWLEAGGTRSAGDDFFPAYRGPLPVES